MMKKLISVVLAVMMALALAIPAFADTAAPEYSITLTPQNETVSLLNQTYSAYKLFDVEYPDADTDGAPDAESYSYTISTDNPYYKNNSAKAEIEKYFTLTASASDADTLVVTPKVDSDNKSLYTTVEARKLADALQPYLPATADGSVKAAAADSATISLTAPGYYLVFGTAAEKENAEKIVTAAISLTTAKKNAAAKVKADVPEIDKNIVENNAPVKYVDARIGDAVSFQLDSKVPDTTGYSKYVFIMHDTMSSGLKLDTESFIVTVGTTQLTAEEDYELDLDPGDGETFTVSFLKMTTYTAGDPIVVTYKAILTEDVKTTCLADNKAKLEYSHNPYDTDDTETTETPVIDTHVYTFEIRIIKVDGEDNTKMLSGATFVLKNEVGKFYKISDGKIVWVENEEDAASVTTVEDGRVTFFGLDKGNYFLHETQAPEGYNPLTSDVKVTISPVYTANGNIDVNDEDNNICFDDVEGPYYVSQTVENNTGVILPETGGMGTVLFISLGLILFTGTTVVLVTKKRLYNEG